jgi:hypothetical protein
MAQLQNRRNCGRFSPATTGYYNVGDRMKLWGKMGAFWGYNSAQRSSQFQELGAYTGACE